MSQILVIDPRQAARSRVVRILSAEPKWTIVEADTVEHALTMTRLVPLDLVLADFDSPELDAGSFVEQLSAEQPMLPVLVTGGQGSLERARQALESAAAGYLLHSRIEHDLVPAIRTILGVAQDNRMTLQSLDSQQSTFFEMENDPSRVAGVVKHVTGQCSRFGITNERERLRVAVALEEALLNAMIHGNLEVSSELRERSDDAFRELIQRRRGESPYAARRVRLQCDFAPTQVQLMVRDQGPGFDVGALPDPRDPEYMLRASGRGVLLMRTFMDEVTYNERGNEVTLVKRRPAGQDVFETWTDQSWWSDEPMEH